MISKLETFVEKMKCGQQPDGTDDRMPLQHRLMLVFEMYISISERNYTIDKNSRGDYDNP